MSRSVWAGWLAGLTAAMLLVQGYHPLAEDGGLYVAGVERLLDPRLFPRYTEFVTAPTRFSVFAPVVAALVRLTGLPLAWVLLGVYALSLATTLAAGRAILRRCGNADAAQLAGVALLAVAATLPVAGTSLLLVDPYVTARSLSTPLSLLAIAWALEAWAGRPGRRFAWACAAALLVAAAFHPLMAGYGLAVVLALRLLRLRRWPLALGLAAALAILLAGCVQAAGPPDSAAVVQAADSRYYWFLSQWQWYEWLGLAGPAVVLLLLRAKTAPNPPAAATRLPAATHPAAETSPPAAAAHPAADPAAQTNPSAAGVQAQRRLVAACLYVACLALVIAGVFAHRDAQHHLVARLQPLRAFLLVYAVLLLLLGATAGQRLRRIAWWPPAAAAIAVAIAVAVAVTMFAVQRATFPGSAHIELPGRVSANPWVQAFLWARDHTPPTAVLALDARYVNQDGEDAQSVRATAERSAVPDFSKDGGEAAIAPSLAAAWLAGAQAQASLSTEGDAQRAAHLQGSGATWVVLRTAATTAWDCPYRNPTVKVCRLGDLR